MIINSDGFSFDFTDAINAFVFDETDRTRPTYHGQPMKAVDIVAEFDDAYIYVEMKDFYDPDRYNQTRAVGAIEIEEKRKAFTHLTTKLKYKYRDSYLYRHAEHKVDKPIHYICLLTFENGLNVAMQKALRGVLPVGKASPRWEQEIMSSCQVVNVAKWNENFPKWPVTRI